MQPVGTFRVVPALPPALESLRELEAANWDFFLNRLPAEVDRALINVGQVTDSQLLQPLFEFSGACAGCGETPYLKLLSQLFGDRALIANATGCRPSTRQPADHPMVDQRRRAGASLVEFALRR